MYDSSHSLSFLSGTEQSRRHVGIWIVGEDFSTTHYHCRVLLVVGHAESVL